MKKFLFFPTLLAAMMATIRAAADEKPAEPLMSVTFHIEPTPDEQGVAMPVTAAEIAQTIAVIKHRLKFLDINQASLASRGSNHILMLLRGIKPEHEDRIRAILEKTGRFELRQVSRRNDEPDANGRKLAARVKDVTELVPGYRAFDYKRKDDNGKVTSEPILLNRRTALTSADLEKVMPSLHQPAALEITLNRDGVDKMIALTKNMQPKRDRIAILLDGEVVCVPVVNMVPLGKHFVIEDLEDDYQVLACALTHPLRRPVKVDAIRSK